MSNLAKKVAIVTGASSGIGEATAIDLAESGARVVLAARREDRLSQLEKRIKDSGGEAISIACDVRQKEQVERVVSTTLTEYGSIDILINNAGVMPVSPISACRFDDWDRMIDINIKGALYVIGYVLPHMLNQQSGHIVNVSSVAGRNIFPGNTVYSGTKHMLHVISEGLRKELAQADPPNKKIRITTIAPGAVLTELHESTTDEATREQVSNYYKNLEGVLVSKDISRAIIFALESPDNVNVNEIVVRPTAQVG